MPICQIEEKADETNDEGNHTQAIELDWYSIDKFGVWINSVNNDSRNYIEPE